MTEKTTMTFRHPSRRNARGSTSPLVKLVPAHLTSTSGSQDIAMHTYGPITPSYPSREVRRQSGFPWLFVAGVIYGVFFSVLMATALVWWLQ